MNIENGGVFENILIFICVKPHSKPLKPFYFWIMQAPLEMRMPPGGLRNPRGEIALPGR